MREPVPARKSAQWRHGQRDHDQAQSPITEAVEDFLDRVSAQGSSDIEDVADDERQRQQAGNKDKGLPDEPDLRQRVQAASEIASEVEVFVEVRDLLPVAIEHQRRLLVGKQARTDAAFARLAPAWMVDIGIHVGVETVFSRL